MECGGTCCRVPLPQVGPGRCGRTRVGTGGLSGKRSEERSPTSGTWCGGERAAVWCVIPLHLPLPPFAQGAPRQCEKKTRSGAGAQRTVGTGLPLSSPSPSLNLVSPLTRRSSAARHTPPRSPRSTRPESRPPPARPLPQQHRFPPPAPRGAAGGTAHAPQRDGGVGGGEAEGTPSPGDGIHPLASPGSLPQRGFLFRKLAFATAAPRRHGGRRCRGQPARHRQGGGRCCGRPGVRRDWPPGGGCLVSWAQGWPRSRSPSPLTG